MLNLQLVFITKSYCYHKTYVAPVPAKPAGRIPGSHSSRFYSKFNIHHSILPAFENTIMQIALHPVN